jgi:hypothetical protein
MRVKGESGSIESLAKLVRTSIEQEIPLHYRLRLEDEDLYVDQDVVCHPLPTVPSSSPFESASAAIAIIQKQRGGSSESISTLGFLPESISILGFSPAQLRELAQVLTQQSISANGLSLISSSDLRSLLLRGAKTMHRWLPSQRTLESAASFPPPVNYLPAAWVGVDAAYIAQLVLLLLLLLFYYFC